MIEIRKNETTPIMEIKKNTILVGQNGAGKTTILTKLASAKFFDDSGVNTGLTVFKAGVENVKEDVDAAKAAYKQANIEFNSTLESVIVPNQAAINSELNAGLASIQAALGTPVEEVVISPLIKLKHEVAINTNFISRNIFEFNGHEYSLKDMPSGVRKLVHVYFNTKQSVVGKKLILLDEIDSMLHPSWVKLVADLVKGWMIDPDTFVVLSTHKPEFIYQMNDYVEDIAKVNIAMDGIEYIDITRITRTFNDINSHVVGRRYAPINNIRMISKLKVKMSFQLSRLFFTANEEVILVEGLTDQMFFKNKTSKLVISLFGFFQAGMYLSILEWIKDGYDGVSMICDGDNKLLIPTSLNSKLRDKLDVLNIVNYFYPIDLERNQYGDPTPIGTSIETNKKFELLEANYMNVSFPMDVQDILD